MRLPIPPSVVTLSSLALLAFLPGCAAFVQYGSDTDGGIGVRGNLPLGQVISQEDQRGERAVSRLEMAVSAHQFFPSAGDYTEANVDLLLPLVLLGDGAARTYVGSGLHVGRFSPDLGGSDTRVGLNLLAGLRFDRRVMAPFFEVRGSLGGTDQLSALVGVQIFGGLF
jgi:hypothetical protein